MGVNPTNAKRVSPKVTASTASSAVAVVLSWLLTEVPFIADAPGEVRAALVVLCVAGATFAAGYLRRDPARF